MRSNVQEAVSIIEEDLKIARDLAQRVLPDTYTAESVFSILSLLYTEMSIIVQTQKLEQKFYSENISTTKA